MPLFKKLAQELERCQVGTFEGQGASSASLLTVLNRDRGEPRGSTPPTPPCVRVRTRRFGWLSVATNAGLWDTRSAADGSALARQPSGLHPYSLPGRPAMLVFCRFPPARSAFLHLSNRSGLRCALAHLLCPLLTPAPRSGSLTVPSVPSSRHVAGLPG